jgi:hypothetical protein
VAPVSVPASPSPTSAASALPNLPPTLDGPVPADLQPSVGAAPEDYPKTFADGCNVPEGGTASRGSCLYGDLASKTTIALFGDSHAAFWFPAVEGFAERQGWRMLNLTMSSCTPADLSVYNSIYKRIYTECPAWRGQAPIGANRRGRTALDGSRPRPRRGETHALASSCRSVADVSRHTLACALGLRPHRTRVRVDRRRPVRGLAAGKDRVSRLEWPSSIHASDQRLPLGQFLGRATAARLRQRALGSQALIIAGASTWLWYSL